MGATSWSAATVLLLTLLAGACGYRPVSLAHPFGAQSVAVMPFVEHPPVGISDVLAARLGAALRAGGARVATATVDADAVLEGELRVTSRPGTTLQAVQVYHVDGVIDARWRGRDGAVCWSGQVSASESFLPQGTPGLRQPAATETQRRMALQRLAEALALRLEHALVAAQHGDAAESTP